MSWVLLIAECGFDYACQLFSLNIIDAPNKLLSGLG